MFQRLERFFKNSESKMTRERYFKMCEQLDKEPIEDEIPPDWEDFPEIVVDAINTFQNLRDFIVADIGYLGKDYTNLPYYIQIYDIQDIELFLEILTTLESRAVKQSQEQLKRERDKLKRKH